MGQEQVVDLPITGTYIINVQGLYFLSREKNITSEAFVSNFKIHTVNEIES